MLNEINNKNKWFILLIITNVISVCVAMYFIFDNHKEPIYEPNKIIVQIMGEVNEPNVYELDEGTRLSELIELAGGFTENADIETVNQALQLRDEMKITILSIQSNEENQEQENGKININTADLDLLMSLSGIGEVKAQAIIDFREKNGPFTMIEEIQFVSGIGEKTFENIKDDIYC